MREKTNNDIVENLVQEYETSTKAADDFASLNATIRSKKAI